CCRTHASISPITNGAAYPPNGVPCSASNVAAARSSPTTPACSRSERGTRPASSSAGSDIDSQPHPSGVELRFRHQHRQHPQVLLEPRLVDFADEHLQRSRLRPELRAALIAAVLHHQLDG